MRILKKLALILSFLFIAISATAQSFPTNYLRVGMMYIYTNNNTLYYLQSTNPVTWTAISSATTNSNGTVTYYTNSLINGLVSFWPFDEASNSSTHRDVFGTSTFTGTGSNTRQSVTGLTRPTATYVNTNNALMSLSSAESAKFLMPVSGGKTFTIGCWVKFNSFNQNVGGNTYINALAGSDYGQWHFGALPTGVPIFDVVSTNLTTFRATGTYSLNTNKWYYVDGYYDSVRSVSGIQVNGIVLSEVAVTNNNIVQPTSPIVYMSSSTSYNDNFTIQDLAVWNRILSTNEMTALYNNGSGNTYPFTTVPTVPITIQTNSLLVSTNTLLNNLVSFWPMDDAAGTTVGDAFSSANLSGGGTFANVTGKTRKTAVSMSTNISPPAASLAESTAKFLLGSNNWTVALWYKPVDFANYYALAGIWDGTSNRREWLVQAGPTGQARIAISPDGSTTYTFLGNYLNLNAWNFIVYYYNASTGKAGISVNGGTPVETNMPGPLATSGSTFALCGVPGGSGSTMNGAMQDCGIWSRVLTPTEITTLYNGGNGNTYPFASSPVYNTTFVTTNSLVSGLMSFWPLDESTSTTRRDVFGSSTLTNSSAIGTSSGITRTLAAQFSNNQLVSSDNKFNFNGQNFTVNTWVNLPYFTNSDYFVSRWNTSNLREWTLFANANSGLGFSTSLDGQSSLAVSPGFFPTNAWVMITATLSGTTASVYTNGVLAATGTVYSPTNAGAVLSLGYATPVGGSDANYKEQDCGIWNRALSATEIATLYNGGLGNTYPFNGTVSATTPLSAYSTTIANNSASATYLTSIMSARSKLCDYWPMDDANSNGNRRDIWSGNTLAYNTGSYSYSTGKVRQFCTQLNNSGAQLNHNVSTVEGTFSSSFGVTFLFNAATLNAGTTAILSVKQQNSPYSANWTIQLSGSSLQFTANGSGSAVSVPITTGWHFIYCYADTTRNVIGIVVDGNAAVEVSHTGLSVPAGAQVIILGSSSTYLVNTYQIEGIALYHNTLTPSELSALYNNGAFYDLQ